MRLFIAVALPHQLQECIEKRTAALREKLGGSIIRWVATRNLHLTVKFLGEVPKAQLPALRTMLGAAAHDCAAFTLAFGGLGYFPGRGKPRVLWMGIEPEAALLTLHEKVEAGAARLGYPPEDQPFSGHLTFGRVRRGPEDVDLRNLRAVLQETQIDQIGQAMIDRIHLFQSDLQPSGPLYTSIFSAPLFPAPTSLRGGT